MFKIAHKRPGQCHRKCGSQLHAELLEDRRVLATFTVTNLGDGPVNGPGAQPGTLRQAIFDANVDGVADTIQFAPGNAGTVALTAGPLTITQPVTLSGLGAAQTTIDAGGLSTVINVDDGSFGSRILSTIEDVTVSGSDNGVAVSVYADNLTLRNTIITGNAGTGVLGQYGVVTLEGSVVSTNRSGIQSLRGTLAVSGSVVRDNTYRGIGSDYSDVSIDDSTLSDNGTYGFFGGGNATFSIVNSELDNNGAGGIRTTFDPVTLTVDGTRIRNNDGPGVFADVANMVTITGSTIHANNGLGISVGEARDVQIHDSVISANTFHGIAHNSAGADESLSVMRTTISDNGGSGIAADSSELSIDACTISGNSASGIRLNFIGETTITNSTIHDNHAADGGGLYVVIGGPIAISNSTFSGNSATQQGGGILAAATNGLEILSTTITSNAAASGQGSGFFGRELNGTHTIESSIISGNSQSDFDLDVNYPGSAQSNGFNVVGSGNAVALFSNNDQVGISDPQLFPLAFKGGPTMTHRPQPGSVVIDSGNPAAVAGAGQTSDFDQRGNPFTRVYNGRIDVGAVESQPSPTGDFNGDGAYDCADVDSLIAAVAQGDYDLFYDINADGMLDTGDRDRWLADAGSVNLGPGKVYLLGDANLDGAVNGADFLIWNANKFQPFAAWCQADFTADGQVNGADFLAWNSNKFQMSAPVADVLPNLTGELDSRSDSELLEGIGSTDAEPAPLQAWQPAVPTSMSRPRRLDSQAEESRPTERLWKPSSRFSSVSD